MGNFLFKKFIKDYENTSDFRVREQYGRLAGIVGIISNVFLCAMKITIGVIINSIAVIADGINNLTDASSSVITLIGFKLASMPEDEDHPYGHARIEYLTGLLVSVIIILLGIQLLCTSFDKVLHPDPLQFSYATIVILVLAIIIKIWQAMFYLSAGKKIRSVALTASGMDSRNDVISTSVVLISIIVGKVSGLQLDGIMGCVVALFIVWSGIQLIRETSSPLLGEAPDPDLVATILERASAYEGVLGTHDLMIHNYGPGRVFASIHIEVDSEEDIMVSHDMVDNLERVLSEELKIHLTVHMDPVKLGDPLICKLKAVIEDALLPMEGVYGMHDLRIVPGPTHTNVIFDTVIAPDCKISQGDIRCELERHVKQVDSRYFVVTTFDTAYTKPQD